MKTHQESKAGATDPTAADMPFSFGVLELGAAEQRRQECAVRLAREEGEAREAGELKLVAELDRPNLGFDPYNSGSFDRYAAWQRIARRP